MKICWDNLEGLRMSDYLANHFRKNQTTYMYKDSCLGCGDPFLTENSRQGIYCCISCANSVRGQTESTRLKISEIAKNRT